MKVVISIFCLPQEIDELEKTLIQLNSASKYVSGINNFIIDVTLCVSSELTDWNNSKLSKNFFIEKIKKISAYADWCEHNIRVSEDIKGCVSQRRFTSNNYDADCFIWLDTDIVFDEYVLSFIERAITLINKDTNYFILSPEIVRVWDKTWDCLVNGRFIEKPIGYYKTNNPYHDCGVKGDVSVEEMIQYKFAGGWFTCISGDLIRKIGIPESFGHYGYEDTFIMKASHKLSNVLPIKQFKLKNYIVCENHKYKMSNYSHQLSSIDKKEEFRKIAENNFQLELNKI